MQEGYDDYSEADSGCCLNCADAHDGCLCFSCKCRRCFHYSSPEEYDGESGCCDISGQRRGRAASEKRDFERKQRQWFGGKHPETNQKNLFGQKVRKKYAWQGTFREGCWEEKGNQ